jgi:hypothetical protein
MPGYIGQNPPNALIFPKLKKWAMKSVCTSHIMEVTGTPRGVEKKI